MIKLKTLIKEDSNTDLYATAGEMISQVGLYTQDNADKLKGANHGNLHRFFDTPEQKAKLIEISEAYKEYLVKVKTVLDDLQKDPMYQVAVGDARGQYRNIGVGATLEKAYSRAKDIK